MDLCWVTTYMCDCYNHAYICVLICVLIILIFLATLNIFKQK